MGAAVRIGEFRFADLLRWPETERWQLCDGHATAMAPPNVTHQTVVFELGRQLGNQLIGKPVPCLRRPHRCAPAAWQ